ncbi:MAG TPA: RsmE family RNA methyltransferase [Candidatus Limnocylindria bacterium]|nr:RsmE family RNA methyltransferase [Candidatus Limnocylindria bacterium]
MQTTKHQFAVYVAHLTDLLKTHPRTLRLTDQDLVHRIGHVLRLAVNEDCILFDQTVHALVSITNIAKKQVDGEVKTVNKNVLVEPSITVLLPLLKREALEEALYSCVELGANTVQLMTTQKVQRSWGGEKELQRMHNIMVAAAEQSKNFAFPVLQSPVSLPDALAKVPSTSTKLVAAVQGQPLLPCLSGIAGKKNPLVITFGPEGDFTQEEYRMLQDQHFTMCALTPTVLRAQQALVVLLGAVRSIT